MKIRTFASMNEQKWCERVILADADYVDKVAFDLIVNFERMLGRRIPQADLARWLECVALDGGVRPTPNPQHTSPITQVVLLHRKEQMDNFAPGRYADLDGKAFGSELGEFLVSCVQVPQADTQVGQLTGMDELFMDSLQVVASAPEVKRLMVIPDEEHIYNNVRANSKGFHPDQHVTVFTMQPRESGNFRQEILGYSLMAALGIRGEEVGERSEK